MVLEKFAYPDSSPSSVEIMSFEVLYSRRYRSTICWVDLLGVRLLGTHMLRECLNKIKLIENKIG